MAGAHREHQRLGVQQLEAQPAHQARVAHAAHHQVELAGAQLVEQRGVGGALHHDLHLRPALAQPRQRHRQQRRRHARQGADAQPLDAPARGRRHGLRAGVQRLEHAQRMRQQLLAGRREPLHAAPARVAALDQPRAHDGLQLDSVLDTAGWLSASRSAARARWRSCATATKARRWRSCTLRRKSWRSSNGVFQFLLVMENGSIFNLHHRTALLKWRLPDSSHDRRQRSC
jgi:hypothetical protein